MLEIIPAILEQNFSEIEKKIHLVEGLVDWVQIDIADNTLVPNTTFLDPEQFIPLIKNIRHPEQCHPEFISGSHETLKQVQGDRSVNFELHLMVSDPLKYLSNFAKAGFKRFYAHIEGEHIEEYIEECNRLDVEIGLAIDGPTPFNPPDNGSCRSAAPAPFHRLTRRGPFAGAPRQRATHNSSPVSKDLYQYLDNIDCILVMAIEAGASGRPFREDTIEKIRKIRECDLEIPIAVDGAMNDINTAKVVAAGATRINSNSYIFNSLDVKEAIKKLNGSLEPILSRNSKGYKDSVRT
jgi:ribulose-phosphate 3-epimerase